MICLDADRCSWRSITTNFRSVTFVKQPPSLAEETRPVISGAIGVYGLHTPRKSTLAEGGIIDRNFRKRDEEKFADGSA